MILQNGKTLHIRGKHFSYVMIRNDEEDLLNFHFGAPLSDRDYAVDEPLWREGFSAWSNTANLTSYPQEYPAFGGSDSRNPAYIAENTFGNSISRLSYRSARILRGQAAPIEEMPGLFSQDGDADTLEVTLADETVGLEVRLYYTAWDDFDVLARSAVLINRGSSPLTLRSAYSASVDLPEGQYDVVHFAGEWARERGMERSTMHRGMKTEILDATGRGSRAVNPFVMIASPDATEEQGTVWGLNLLYSCNHSTVVQMDCSDRLRVQQGICPLNFAWELAPGASFCTPQCVIAYSQQGFGALSREYHRLYRTHLMQSKFTHRPRPVLINNWEATYFDFDEEKLVQMARRAKDVGVELFVLDDGWFGNRNSAQTSLGDWTVNRRKLPSGIEGLADRLAELPMQLGLWFEPEMISPDSELYRAHPDWAVRVPQREPVQQRWQLVLDLSRAEVRDHVVRAVSEILRCGKASYVKWDMNRNLTDVPAPGYYHRYALGLYDIMRRLTQAFPDVLFEGCCSGGGRFDAGVLAYMPQIWTSDNSDAIARLRIQYATSMCYPVGAMSAHVTAVPNHQNGRVTSLATRAAVAYAGIFGYELDITTATEDELSQMRGQIERAHRVQQLALEGDFYRLRDPFRTNECAWMLVSPDHTRAFFMACRVLSVIGRDRYYEPRICLRGLDADAQYRDRDTGAVYGGDVLMHHGLTMFYEQADFTARVIELERI